MGTGSPAAGRGEAGPWRRKPLLTLAARHRFLRFGKTCAVLFRAPGKSDYL